MRLTWGAVDCLRCGSYFVIVSFGLFRLGIKWDVREEPNRWRFGATLQLTHRVNCGRFACTWPPVERRHLKHDTVSESGDASFFGIDFIV